MSARQREAETTTGEAAVDLAALRAELDAPAREQEAVKAREEEAEQRHSTGRMLAYARGIAAKLAAAIAATAAWNAEPVDMTAFRRTFGEATPLWRASDNVTAGSWPIADAARIAGEVATLVTELARPTLLSAGRLEAVLKALDRAAGHADGFLAVYAGWIRVREDAVAQLASVDQLSPALRRRWTPTEAERALLARQQEHLAAAAAAMPPVPPKAPRRGISGANFDAVQPVTSARRPMIENLEDL